MTGIKSPAFVVAYGSSKYQREARRTRASADCLSVPSLLRHSVRCRWRAEWRAARPGVERQPRSKRWLLSDSGLRKITDTRWKCLLQPSPLRIGKADVVLRSVE